MKTKITGVTISTTTLLRIYNVFDLRKIDIQGDETQTFLFESVIIDGDIEIDIEFQVSMNRNDDTDQMDRLKYVDSTITAFVGKKEVDCTFDSDLDDQCKKDTETLINRNFFNEK